jgi:hypothetical protein
VPRGANVLWESAFRFRQAGDPPCPVPKGTKGMLLYEGEGTGDGGRGTGGVMMGFEPGPCG